MEPVGVSVVVVSESTPLKQSLLTDLKIHFYGNSSHSIIITILIIENLKEKKDGSHFQLKNKQKTLEIWANL